MQSTPIRTITMAGIAKRAGVGKPTLYRWWDSKCALILEVFLSRVQTGIPVPDNQNPAQALGQLLKSMFTMLGGRPGEIVAEMIGEGQSDAHILEEFRNRFFNPLLQPARTIIDQGKANGDLAADLDTETALDLIFGPVYYRLIIGHQPLDEAFLKSLVDRIPFVIGK